MTSTIITPDKAMVLLPIPPLYIGKQVEVTFTLVNETTKPKKQKPEKKLSDMFRGVLSKESAENFMAHIKTMREEWEDI